MNYNKLGASDIKVSEICLGTMTFGEQNTEADAHQQLDYALGNGVNFIDTAEMYAVPGRKETQGLTEKYIGTWIQKRGRRDDFVLATKVTGPSPGMPYIRDPLNFSKQQINTAIEGSLKRLQTDYVDLYQLHWPERKVNMFGVRSFPSEEQDTWENNMLDILDTLEKLKQAGKIRAIGISNETPWGLMSYLQLAKTHNLPRVSTIQNVYNLLNRTFEIGLSEICIREQVGLLAYSPLAFGLLSNKYFDGSDVSNARLQLFPQMARYASEASQKAAKAYFDIAQANNMSLAQLANTFVNRKAFVASNIIGATTLEQLKENLDTATLSLSESIYDAINEVYTAIPDPSC